MTREGAIITVLKISRIIKISFRTSFLFTKLGFKYLKRQYSEIKENRILTPSTIEIKFEPPFWISSRALRD